MGKNAYIHTYMQSIHRNGNVKKKKKISKHFLKYLQRKHKAHHFLLQSSVTDENSREKIISRHQI